MSFPEASAIPAPYARLISLRTTTKVAIYSVADQPKKSLFFKDGGLEYAAEKIRYMRQNNSKTALSCHRAISGSKLEYSCPGSQIIAGSAHLEGPDRKARKFCHKALGCLQTAPRLSQRNSSDIAHVRPTRNPAWGESKNFDASKIALLWPRSGPPVPLSRAKGAWPARPEPIRNCDIYLPRILQSFRCPKQDPFRGPGRRPPHHAEFRCPRCCTLF
jgi:hypothetical protein